MCAVCCGPYAVLTSELENKVSALEIGHESCSVAVTGQFVTSSGEIRSDAGDTTIHTHCTSLYSPKS